MSQQTAARHYGIIAHYARDDSFSVVLESKFLSALLTALAVGVLVALVLSIVAIWRNAKTGGG